MTVLCWVAGALLVSAQSLPRTSWDRKPDLTGVWQGARLTPRAYGLPQLELLYQPAVKEKMKALSENDDPVRHCAVYGYPRRMATGLAIQIVQTIGQLLILDNRPHIYRYIPIDGRQHEEDLFPSYQGDSVGRWEGDTLVVDVTMFNGRIWLAGADEHPSSSGAGGWIVSDALHEVERWRLLSADRLEYQATIDDAKSLTGKWTSPPIVLKRLPKGKLADEGHCIPEEIDFQTPPLK